MKLKLKNKKVILLVGLGNPGMKYRKTRHNAGFAVVDFLAAENGLIFKKAFLKPYETAVFDKSEYTIILIKPLTFMNRSGDILHNIFRKTGADASDLVVICDNMDLRPGRIRLKKGGSSAGHNGIKSIIENVGNSDFKRMYVGVGRPAKGGSIVEHVLGEFCPEEQRDYDSAVTEAAGALVRLTEKSVELVMNEINKKNN